jgi:GH25 family lysozyme M1 (1,4-beta-N-acetylmuramidase)
VLSKVEKNIFELKKYSKRPEGNGLWILDISSYQSKIDWSSLSGVIDGVIIKVGFADSYYGGGFDKIDPRFKYNQKEARAIGLKVGYYYYPFFDESPIVEANRFTSAVGKLKENENLWLDLEERGDNVTSSWILEFLSIVETHYQRTCHLYVEYSLALEFPWIKRIINNERKIWLAHYGNISGKDLHSTPAGNVLMHQYSRKGKILGIKTAVDLNKFLGSEKEWKQLSSTIYPRKKIAKKELPKWPIKQHSLYIRNIETSESYSYNEDMVFEGSSVIKIAVILYTLQFIKNSKYTLDTVLNIKDEHLSNGSGVIAWTNWRKLTIYQLICCIDRYSDCTATNRLLDFFGGIKPMNRFINENYPHTRMYIKRLHFEDDEIDMPLVSKTTAKEIAELTTELLITGTYSKLIRRAFKTISNPWYGFKINPKILGVKKLFIKTGSMKMIGINNDTVLNFTGVIVDKTGTYEFASLNRLKLGPLLSEEDLEKLSNEIAYNFISKFVTLKG